MIKKVVIPVIRELPIILIFFVLIRFSFFDLFNFFTYDIFESIVTLCFWFLYAYFIAATICFFKKAWLRWFWYIFLFLVYAVAFFIGTLFEMKISPTLFTLLFETNDREAGEFFATYAFCAKSISVYFKILACIAFAVTIEFAYRRYILPHVMSVKSRAASYIFSYIILCVLCLGLYGCSRVIDYFRANSDNVTDLLEFPADDIYTRLLCSLYISYNSCDDIERAVDVSLHAADVSSVSEHRDSLKIVFVIGESYNKMHAGLYGYSLPTTPNLQMQKEKGNLFVFNDVITPYNYTSMSIKNMMSCNSLMDSEKWCDYPFFPLLFRKAGYDVLFWDNQRDMYDNCNCQYAVNSYLYNVNLSEKVYSCNNKEVFQYDEQLIDDYREYHHIQSNCLVMFHLMGQHLEYVQRYPKIKRFMKFTPESIKRTDDYMDDEKRQFIANYDNATYYNDYILSRIFDLFSNDNAVLVYLSDHGEEVFDYRDFWGRSYTEASDPQYLKCQFEIPFMVWCSDKYMEKYPETVKAIQESVNKPFMIDNVCQLFFHIGGIQSRYYHSERDLLSPNYICKNRKVKGGTVNYDQIIKK